jgi:hypothetical protein
MHDDLQVASDIGSGNVSFKSGEIAPITVDSDRCYQGTETEKDRRLEGIALTRPTRQVVLWSDHKTGTRR